MGLLCRLNRFPQIDAIHLSRLFIKQNVSRLSLDLLKGFEAAVRREIKTLEEQLGQPPFHRVNLGLRLTDAGETLYRAVSEALLLIEQATGRLTATRKTRNR